jgi:hypothetical protein
MHCSHLTPSMAFATDCFPQQMTFRVRMLEWTNPYSSSDVSSPRVPDLSLNVGGGLAERAPLKVSSFPACKACVASMNMLLCYTHRLPSGMQTLPLC